MAAFTAAVAVAVAVAASQSGSTTMMSNGNTVHVSHDLKVDSF